MPAIHRKVDLLAALRQDPWVKTILQKFMDEELERVRMKTHRDTAQTYIGTTYGLSLWTSPGPRYTMGDDHRIAKALSPNLSFEPHGGFEDFGQVLEEVIGDAKRTQSLIQFMFPLRGHVNTSKEKDFLEGGSIADALREIQKSKEDAGRVSRAAKERIAMDPRKIGDVKVNIQD